jgi:hypothetical protein
MLTAFPQRHDVIASSIVRLIVPKYLHLDFAVGA